MEKNVAKMAEEATKKYIDKFLDEEFLQEKLILGCQRGKLEKFKFLLDLAQSLYKKDFVEKISEKNFNLLQFACQFNYKDSHFEKIEYLLKNFNFDINVDTVDSKTKNVSCLDLTDLHSIKTIQILFETGKLNLDIQDRFYKRIIADAITERKIETYGIETDGTELLELAMQRDYKKIIAFVESKKPKISLIKLFMNTNFFVPVIITLAGLTIMQLLLK